MVLPNSAGWRQFSNLIILDILSSPAIYQSFISIDTPKGRRSSASINWREAIDTPSEPAGVLDELKAEWRTLIACVLGVFLGTLPGYAIGAFLEPVAAELESSLTQIVGWSLCWSIGVVATAPFAGYLADRHGAKRVALIAVAALALALGWTTFGVTTLITWYVSGFVIGAAVAGVGGITFGRIVSSLFHRGLGTGLGIMSTGVGLSAMLGPSTMQGVIDAFGWRAGFAAEAIIVVLILPLLGFWLKDAASNREPGTLAVDGVALRTAVRTPVFWLLVLGTLMYGVSVAGVSVNLMPYLAAEGMTRSSAAAALGLFGASTLVGRLLTGIIIDKVRIHAAALIALMLTAEGLAFIMFAYQGTAMLLPTLVIFGFAVGAEGDCLAYLVARFFGRRFFSSIFGMLGIVTLYIGTGTGPALFALTREYLGAYPPTLIVWSILTFVGAAAFLATARTAFRDPPSAH